MDARKHAALEAEIQLRMIGRALRAAPSEHFTVREIGRPLHGVEIIGLVAPDVSPTLGGAFAVHLTYGDLQRHNH